MTDVSVTLHIGHVVSLSRFIIIGCQNKDRLFTGGNIRAYNKYILFTKYKTLFVFLYLTKQCSLYLCSTVVERNSKRLAKPKPSWLVISIESFNRELRCCGLCLLMRWSSPRALNLYRMAKAVAFVPPHIGVMYMVCQTEGNTWDANSNCCKYWVHKSIYFKPINAIVVFHLLLFLHTKYELILLNRSRGRFCIGWVVSRWVIHSNHYFIFYYHQIEIQI